MHTLTYCSKHKLQETGTPQPHTMHTNSPHPKTMSLLIRDMQGVHELLVCLASQLAREMHWHTLSTHFQSIPTPSHPMHYQTIQDRCVCVCACVCVHVCVCTCTCMCVCACVCVCVCVQGEQSRQEGCLWTSLARRVSKNYPYTQAFSPQGLSLAFVLTGEKAWVHGQFETTLLVNLKF